MLCRSYILNHASTFFFPSAKVWSCICRRRGGKGEREMGGRRVCHLSYTPMKCQTLPVDNLFSAAPRDTLKYCQPSERGLGVRQWHDFRQKCSITHQSIRQHYPFAAITSKRWTGLDSGQAPNSDLIWLSSDIFDRYFQLFQLSYVHSYKYSSSWGENVLSFSPHACLG